jgi:hypothetical protein
MIFSAGRSATCVSSAMAYDSTSGLGFLSVAR